MTTFSDSFYYRLDCLNKTYSVLHIKCRLDGSILSRVTIQFVGGARNGDGSDDVKLPESALLWPAEDQVDAYFPFCFVQTLLYVSWGYLIHIQYSALTSHYRNRLFVHLFNIPHHIIIFFAQPSVPIHYLRNSCCKRMHIVKYSIVVSVWSHG